MDTVLGLMPKKRVSEYAVSLSLPKIGRVMKRARENLRMSYRDLSKVCGVSPAQIRRIEIGETDFSTDKLFRVAVSLGVPIADVISYAAEIRAEFNFDQARADDDYEGALGWAIANGHKEAKARRYLDAFLDVLFVLLLQEFSGSVSSGLAGPFTTSERCNRKFDDIDCQLIDFSNSERASAFQSLLQNPYAKLSALGLVSFEIFQEVITAPGPCEHKGGKAASIIRTLGFEEE